MEHNSMLAFSLNSRVIQCETGTYRTTRLSVILEAANYSGNPLPHFLVVLWCDMHEPKQYKTLLLHS